VFIASPGGLDGERKACRQAVTDFNEKHALRQDVAFIAHGWEDAPGALGRPQELINRFVRESDYLVMVVGDRLGSPTTVEPPFLTGVEEELLEALTCVGSPKHPMRDLLLLFKAVDRRRLVVPDGQLQRVLDFRDRIERSKEILFHTIETVDDLRAKLQQNLWEWAVPLSEKVPVPCPVLLASIRDQNRQSMERPAAASPDELVSWAEARAAIGLTTQADSAFARAAEHERPEDLERYAIFARRTGQLDRSYALNEQILSLPDVVVSDEPSMVATRSRALANMGLIKRKQGDLPNSKRLLDEAAQTAAGEDDVVVEARAYALDLLGLTQAREGRVGDAKASHEQALALRQRAGDRAGEAKTLINLARLAREDGDTQAAKERLDEAIRLLDGMDDQRPALANALTSLGQTVAASAPDYAAELFKRALKINEFVKHTDGVSVVAGDLARLHLAQGDPSAARPFARRVMQVSRDSANREGLAVGLRLLGEVEHASGNSPRAAELLQQAVEAAVTINDPFREAAARLVLARVLLTRGQPLEFERMVDQGLLAAERAGNLRIAEDLRKLGTEASA
jgi:tetratricopeptide (TPR) repeat protein